MPGWWCSTPATPPTAAPRSAPAPKVVERAPRRRLWTIGVEDTRSGAVRRGQGAAARQRRRALGRPCAVRRRRPERRRTMSGWCRAATSSCRRSSTITRAYFFQNADGRIIFAIPYEHDFTLIGTTDRDYHGDPGERRRSATARSTISARRRASISPSRSRRADIVWTYSGVRPLYDDGASKAQEATRDYVLKADGGDGRRAAPQYLRRQDHHLSPAGRSDAGEDRGSSRHARASRGPRARRCRAAISRRPASTAEVAELKARLPLPRPAATRGGWSGSTARARETLLGVAKSHADLGRRLRRRPLRGRGALPDGARMGADRRGRAVAAHQARPAVSRERGGGARRLHEIGRERRTAPRPNRRLPRSREEAMMLELRNVTKTVGGADAYPRRVADASSTAR